MRIKHLAHICPFLRNNISYNENDNFTNESIYKSIEDITPTIHELTEMCQWGEITGKCSHLLEPIMTEDGICFTFNALNSHEMYTDEYVYCSKLYYNISILILIV